MPTSRALYMSSARAESCSLATPRLYSATLRSRSFSLICDVTVLSCDVAWLYFSTAMSTWW